MLDAHFLYAVADLLVYLTLSRRGGWLNAKIVYLRAATRLSGNPVRRRISSLICSTKLQLSDAACYPPVGELKHS